MQYEVEYHEKEDGTQPAREFILAQDEKTIAKINALVDILRLLGPAMRAPHSKSLQDGIFELRVRKIQMHTVGCIFS